MKSVSTTIIIATALMLVAGPSRKIYQSPYPRPSMSRLSGSLKFGRCSKRRLMPTACRAPS